MTFRINNYGCFTAFSMIAIFGLFICCNTNLFAQDSTEIQINDSTQTPIEQTQKVDTLKPDKNPTIIVLSDPLLDSNSLDFKIFTSVNYSRSSFKNTFIPLFDNSMAPMSFFMPISMFAYGRIKDKTYEENTGYLLAGSLITNTAVTFVTKMLVKRKRVRVYSVRYGIYPKVYTSVDPYSFPSGHTSTSFAIATMFALRYPSYPQVYLPIYGWAMVIGYGRMYLGMHYPSDVIAGAIIGTGSSILIHSLRKELLKFKNNLFSEQKNDDGSINAGTLSIFAAGFFSSIVFNQFIHMPGSKLTFNASPFHNNNIGFGLNMNYKF